MWGTLLGHGEPGWDKNDPTAWSLGSVVGKVAELLMSSSPLGRLREDSSLERLSVWMALSESLRNSPLGELRWLAGTPNRPDSCHAVLTQGSDWG